MITEQDVIERLSAFEDFSLGEKGTVHIWRDKTSLGLLIYHHWSYRTGFVGRTTCDSYEISVGCIDSSEGESEALDKMLKALIEFKPYELPSQMKRARYMLWAVDIIKKKSLEFKDVALTWTNKANSIQIVFRDAGLSHGNLLSRWGARVRRELDSTLGIDRRWYVEDLDENIKDGPFIVKFEWLPEKASV